MPEKCNSIFEQICKLIQKIADLSIGYTEILQTNFDTIYK